jgi:hypothetical protein
MGQGGDAVSAEHEETTMLGRSELIVENGRVPAGIPGAADR